MRLQFSLPSVALALMVFAIPLLIPTSVVLAVSASDISVDIIPPNPVPYENTTINLSSYAANLDSVLISWFVNGKKVSSGVGQKSFSVTSGASGSETRVEVSIKMPDKELNKRITIRPSVMVLLWQANDSYVPPFYKGKALLSKGSEVKIVAMPEIKVGNGMVNSKNMTYSWKQDYTNDQEGSGYGKNYFLYIDDYLENASNVSVVASTLDQGYSSAATITTAATTPQIVFYKRDTTSGTFWEQALVDGHRVSGDETILAIPYYISPKNFKDPALVFHWYINDEIINVQNFFKNLLPVRVEGGVSGSSQIRLDIENTEELFQTASKVITVEF